MTTSDIRFWVPMFPYAAESETEKGLRPGEAGFDPKRHMRVYGLVSTDKLDLHEERVLQNGLDFADLKWFNDDHLRNTAVGVPERTAFLRKGERGLDGKPVPKTGWYVDGYLLPTKRGIELFETAEALEKAEAPHRIGFSIQGPALKRANIIHGVKVREIAVTTLPVNTDTYLTTSGLVKSLMAGYDGAATGGDADDGNPLLRESLEGKMTEENAVMVGKGCKTAADFASDQRERGMSKSEYEAALEKAGKSDTYASAMQFDRIEKSLAGLDRRLAAAAAAIDNVDERANAATALAKSLEARKSAGGDEDEGEGGDEDEGEGGDEDEGEGGDEDEGEGGKEEVAKSIRALGNLVEVLAEKVIALDERLVTVQGEVEKSLTTANAPLAARGMRAAPPAAAAATPRRGFGEPGQGNGTTPDRDTIRKSLRSSLADALKANDQNAVHVIGDIMTFVDLGQLDRASQMMERAGLAVG